MFENKFLQIYSMIAAETKAWELIVSVRNWLKGYFSSWCSWWQVEVENKLLPFWVSHFLNQSLINKGGCGGHKYMLQPLDIYSGIEGFGNLLKTLNLMGIS